MKSDIEIAQDAKLVHIKEVAKNSFWGAVSGAASGGVASITATTGSATQMIVNKGFQAGANMCISRSAYVMQEYSSGSNIDLYGYGMSTISGFISGVTFNAPTCQALGISLGLEAAGNGEEIIEIFLEKFN